MGKGRIKVKAVGDTAGRELRKEAMDRGQGGGEGKFELEQAS